MCDNRIAILKSEQKSLELPEIIKCDECHYEGTNREFECWQCEREAMDEAMELKSDIERGV